MTKVRKLKTGVKKIKGRTEVIAEAVQCDESTVRKVLNQERSNETEIGQKIDIAAAIYDEKYNLLIKEVKRVVNF